MDEYIKREDAIKRLRGACIAKYPQSFSYGIFASADEISKLPAADVVCRNDIIEAFDAYISEMTVSKYGTLQECNEARWAVKTAVNFVLGEKKEQP